MKKISVLFFILLTYSSYASILNISSQQGDIFNAVVVEKDKKKLHLVKVTGDGVTVLKSVSVLTGKAKGDKQVSGDEKTPEGYYRVMGFLSRNRLKEMYGDASKIYGYGAYPLNYPNALDNLKGKTGGGIWLHGVEDNRKDPATRGCVAFDNDNVKEVGSYLSKGTPVIITSSAIEGSADKYHRLFQDARQTVLKYLEAWQNNNFKDFSRAYSKDFKARDGKRLPAYLNYKKSLMDLYPNRKIAADKFRVFYESENEAVVEFNQYYSADNITAFGRKTLYLKKEDGAMRIIAEDFEQTKGWDVKSDMEVAKADIREPETDKTPVKEPVKQAPVKETVKAPVKEAAKEPVKETVKPAVKPAVPAKPVEVVIEDNTADISKEINGFLISWKQAWESRNIDSYIALYGDEFKSGGMNRTAWKKDKAKKFAVLNSVRVELDDIKIEILSPERFEVTFTQRYSGDAYSDKGIKTLRLDSSKGEMRIISEQWRAE